jgi:DNA-binding SARP family transcriptional activator
MSSEPPVVVRCLGRFSIALHGHRLDLDRLRPQSRQVLQMLAVHGEAPVHREVLADALWPEADPRRSFARLHTAVYDLRRFLEPAHEPRRSTLLRHSGQTYRLLLPPGSRSDIADFDRAWSAARHALAAGRDEEAAGALRTAWAAYGGELLPEAGPAEWLQEWRGTLRQRALWVERTLARLGVQP